jgi:hypothetical protein
MWLKKYDSDYRISMRRILHAATSLPFRLTWRYHMNNIYQESKSLLEVREWKEQCRLENKGLTAKEYIEKVKAIAASIKSKYNIRLRKYRSTSAS